WAKEASNPRPLPVDGRGPVRPFPLFPPQVKGGKLSLPVPSSGKRAGGLEPLNLIPKPRFLEGKGVGNRNWCILVEQRQRMNWLRLVLLRFNPNANQRVSQSNFVAIFQFDARSFGQLRGFKGWVHALSVHEGAIGAVEIEHAHR